MLTHHQWGLVAFTKDQFYRMCSRYQLIKWVWKYTCKISSASPRCQRVNDTRNLISKNTHNTWWYSLWHIPGPHLWHTLILPPLCHVNSSADLLLTPYCSVPYVCHWAERSQVGVSLTFQELFKIFSRKIVYSKNRTYENFKLNLCMCAQSMALGTHIKFQLGNSPDKCDFWHLCIFARLFWRACKELVKLSPGQSLWTNMAF